MKYELIVFDMDGVIFQHDNFWYRMHKKYNTLSPGLALTKKYLEHDTLKLAELVINGLWKGKPAKGYLELIKSSKYNPGVKETIKKLKSMKQKTLLLTSGPRDLAERAKKELGIDYIIANHLITKDGRITGSYDWKLKFYGKGKALKEFCQKHKLDIKKVLSVGDNDNDVSKSRLAGFSIAFNSKSAKLKKHCDVAIDSNDLREILKFV